MIKFKFKAFKIKAAEFLTPQSKKLIDYSAFILKAFKFK